MLNIIQNNCDINCFSCQYWIIYAVIRQEIKSFVFLLNTAALWPSFKGILQANVSNSVDITVYFPYIYIFLKCMSSEIIVPVNSARRLSEFNWSFVTWPDLTWPALFPQISSVARRDMTTDHPPIIIAPEHIRVQRASWTLSQFSDQKFVFLYKFDVHLLFNFCLYLYVVHIF